jgi:putative ABC transport system permease protein
MNKAFALGWAQLRREKRQLFTAVAGIAFASTLMLVQSGFQDALYESATRVHLSLKGDLALVSPLYVYMGITTQFSEKHLRQAQGVKGVKSVAPLYVQVGKWRNPEDRKNLVVLLFAIDPERPALFFPGVIENLEKMREPDTLIFDSDSQGEYGPIVEWFNRGEEVITEVENRKTKVVGLFELGTSFICNCNLITTDLNLQRLFPNRKKGLIDIGVISAEPGTDIPALKEKLIATLPADVKVLTMEEFCRLERKYWETAVPIGFIFGMGVFVGLIVGTVIVYQILSTDVITHQAEYATLKAMGYTNRFLSTVVLNQALCLAVLGYIPGFLLSTLIYWGSQEVTKLPIYMTFDRAIIFMILVLTMCAVSGLFAMRKIRTADPADIF